MAGLALWKSVIKKSLREIEITWSTVKTFSEEIETGQRRRDRKFSKKLRSEDPEISKQEIEITYSQLTHF